MRSTNPLMIRHSKAGHEVPLTAGCRLSVRRLGSFVRCFFVLFPPHLPTVSLAPQTVLTLYYAPNRDDARACLPTLVRQMSMFS